MATATATAGLSDVPATRLRLAGVKAPLWSPFVKGLVWRYRAAAVATK